MPHLPCGGLFSSEVKADFTNVSASFILRVEAHKVSQVSSSIGRVAVSKTVGWGFESLLACHLIFDNADRTPLIHAPSS